MSILYVTDQGATITKTGGRVVVRKKNKILEDLPAIGIERVIIFGNAHLTTPAMKFFLGRGIDVSLLSSRGRYKGRLQPEFCKDAELRRKQYKQSCNKKTAIHICKAVVNGKLKNMELFLKRQKRQTPQTSQAINTIKKCLKNLNRSDHMDSVRGYEGSAAAVYYKALNSLLKKEFSFKRRTHNPPEDNVNVLLSLGYTLLYNTIYGIINIVGLDPYQGFYHQSRHGHATLASDLMEEFRAIIVDSIVLLSVNKGEIVPENFSNRHGKIVLDNAGLKRFLNRYEGRLRSVIRHPVQKIQLSNYQCMEAQVRHFARVIYEKEKTYIPFANS